VSVVVFPGQPGVTTSAAVEAFLASLAVATTRAGYGETLARLDVQVGPRDRTAALEPDDYAAVMDHWATAEAATWNRHPSALTSFTAWAQRQEILATNPARRLSRRKGPHCGDRSIPTPAWRHCSATTGTPCTSGCCRG
jgi:hypothetical protein